MRTAENIRPAPRLVILAGLPGTGKTTLARRLAKELSLVYLRVDCVEAPFIAHNPNAGSEGEGYQALINLAAENLRIGLGVVIDTVNPLHLSRAMFMDLSRETMSETFQFELKMRDAALHRKRIEERKSDIPSLKVPTWQAVLNREYDEWDKNKDGPATVIWTDDGEQAFRTCIETIRRVSA